MLLHFIITIFIRFLSTTESRYWAKVCKMDILKRSPYDPTMDDNYPKIMWLDGAVVQRV